MLYLFKKSLTIMVILSFVLGVFYVPNISAGELLEYIDAESASISANNDLVDNGETYWGFEQGTYVNPVITSEQKRAGSNSIRYELASNDSGVGVDRMEHYIEYNYYPTLNHNIWQTTKYLGFSVYFPSDFVTPNDWFVFYQIKQHDSNVNPSPNIAFEVNNSGIVRVGVRRGNGNQGHPDTISTYYNIGNISNYKGKWTDFVVKFKITTETDGFAKVWKKDSTESTYSSIVDYTGMTGYTACRTNYFEIKGGLYRNHMAINHKLYLDEIRYGNAIGDVKFPGSTINEFEADNYSFEASAASAQSNFSPFTVVTDSTAPSGKYIYAPGLNSTGSAPATGQATYGFNMANAGDATLYVTALAPNGGSDSFWYKIDSGSWINWSLTASSDWQVAFRTLTSLSAGAHTLTIAYREGNTKIDSLAINQFDTQAEFASLQSNFSPFTVLNDATASAGKCIYATGYNSTSTAPATGHASYSFKLAKATTIDIYATVLAPSGSADSFWYNIDGGSWIGWYVPTTSSNWQITNTSVASLSAGNHTLTIAYREGNTKIDKISILPR